MKFKRKFIALCLVTTIITGNALPVLALETQEDPLVSDVSIDYVSSFNLDETQIDTSYYFEKIDEINNLREQGDELNALYTVQEMYENLGMDVDAGYLAMCELIIQLQQNRPETLNQSDDERVLDIIRELERILDDSDLLRGYDGQNIASAIKQFLRMTFAEQSLVITVPSAALQVKQCKERANDTTESYYGYSGSGDNTDVFRHAYWNALMSIELNKNLAQNFADAHEQLSSNYMNTILECGYSGQRHTNMDYHNNELGRNCVHSTSTPTTAMNNIIQAIRDNKHYYLHSNYDCNPNDIR